MTSESDILCLFCYKSCSVNSALNCNNSNKVDKSNEKVTRADNNVQRFLVLVERFVGANWRKSSLSSLSWASSIQTSHSCLGCCENCDALISTFCSVYHQLKLLELQLEWKLGTVVNIMKLANKVPSRIAQLKQTFQNFKAENETANTGANLFPQNVTAVKNLRSDFVKTCSGRLAKCQPKVGVKRMKTGDDNALDSFGIQNTNFIVENSSNSSAVAIVQHSLSKSQERIGDDRSISTFFVKIENVPEPEWDDDKASSLKDNVSESDIESANVVEEVEPMETVTKSEEVEFNSAENHDDPLVLNVNNDDENSVKRDNHNHCSNVSINSQEDDDHSRDKDTDIIFSKEDCSPENENRENVSVETAIPAVNYGANELRVEDKSLETATTSRYNLRANRKKPIKVVDSESEENEVSSESSQANDSDNSEVSSESSDINDFDSEMTSESSHVEISDKEEDSLSASSLNDSSSGGTDINCQPQASSVLRSAPIVGIKEDTRYIAKSDVQYYNCQDDGCISIYLDKKLFEDHRQLHTSNEQPCKFCNVVEKNVILLSNHERLKHSNTEQPATCDYFINCPRCQFKTKFLGIYQMHFAKVHIKRRNPLSKMSPKFKKWVFCKICQKRTKKLNQKVHFKQFHDLEGMDHNQIVHCSVSGCAAFFKTADQAYIHEKTVHSSNSCTQSAGNVPNFEQAPNWYCQKDGCSHNFSIKTEYEYHQKLHMPGGYKCYFCNLVEENLIRLSTHERTMHQSKTTLDKVSCGEIKNSGVVCCPRCAFEAQNVALYQCHFAKTHFVGFEDCEQNSAKLSTVRCEMCNMEIDGSKKKSHFAVYHDISGVDPSRTRKCIADGCKAVFRKRSQWIAHTMTEHTSISAAEKQRANSRVFVGLGSISCTIKKCKQTFQTKEDMKSHRKLHGSFKCKFCKVVKSYATELALHELQHAKGKFIGKRTCHYYCARCPSHFLVQRKYIRHHLEEHLNLSVKEPTQICPICKAEFTKTVDDILTKHYKTNHDTEGMDPGDIQRCDLCPAYFTKSRLLVLHKIKDHFRGKCPECNEFIRIEISRFLLHMDEKHPQIDHFPNCKFRCDNKNCKKRFGTETELNHHKNGTQCKLIKCLKCDKEFLGETRWKQHMNIVHPTNPFICSECGKMFSAQTTFLMHLEYHKKPEEWKFDCPTCGKKCTSKEKLEQHERTHTKEKPHICPFCGEKYAHMHNFKNHMKTKHKKEFDEGEAVKGRKVGNYMSRKGSKKGDCIVAGGNTQAD